MTERDDPDNALTIREAAAVLGVHYMTAYRYIRTGRLDAEKVGAEWRVKAEDVARVIPGPDPTGPRPAEDLVDLLVGRLVDGDDGGAWAVIERAMLTGSDPAAIHLDLLVPALAVIGDGWSSGTYTVAQEHQASTTTLRLIGRLSPLFNRRGRKRGSAVVGAPAGDEHRVPVAIVADLLRGAGFRVHDLGCDVPAEAFVQAGQNAKQLVAVGVGATTRNNEASIRAATAAIRVGLGVPVIIGGSAVRDAEHARQLGASEYASSGSALVEQFGETATSHRPDTAGSRR